MCLQAESEHIRYIMIVLFKILHAGEQKQNGKTVSLSKYFWAQLYVRGWGRGYCDRGKTR